MAMLPFSALPHPDESGMSWLLRLTEGNLLRSPWPLLQMLGMQKPRATHLRVDLARVAELCGLPAEAIEPLRCVGVPGGRLIVFRTHKIQRHALRDGRAAVCPHCIRELGYARSVWDLRLVTACPVHKVKLIGQCSNCGSSLTWLRPRLDICRCGHKLSEMKTAPLNDAELAVSSALECALTRSARPWTDNVGASNPLIGEFAVMSLGEALETVKWLARLSGGILTRSMRDDAALIATGAGPILCDWPRSYHAALDAFAARQVHTSEGGSDVGASTLSDAPANLALSRRLHLRRMAVENGRENQVLESEIIRYIKLRFADALLDPRVATAMRGIGVEPNWITLAEAARRLRLDPRAAYRLVEDGRLESRSVDRVSGTRHYVRSDQLGRELHSMRLVAPRKVSRHLGLPLSVVLDLERSLTLGRPGRLGGEAGISQSEIDALLRRWAAVKTSTLPRTLGTTTLYEAFRNKALALRSGWKAEAVRRILAGKLRVFDLKTSPVLDATICLADLQQVFNDYREERMTLGGAGHALGTSLTGILRLVVDGHLSAVLSETEIGFERSEVIRFASNCVQVRKRPKAPVRISNLIAKCEEVGIPAIRAGDIGCFTVFVPRDRAGRLGKLLGQNFAISELPIALQIGVMRQGARRQKPRISPSR